MPRNSQEGSKQNIGLEKSDKLSDVGIPLTLATTALQNRLGEELWNQLHKWSRSCLVTSQLFYETLDRVDEARQRERDNKGDTGEAPEIDFSPVVLCLFKALEIEFERKVLRPFREAVIQSDKREQLILEGKSILGSDSLLRYIRNEGPAPSLWVVAVLLNELSKCRAENHGILQTLKLWMRNNLMRPHRWWGHNNLSQRLMETVVKHRNDAAHTKRFSPLEAKGIADSLWGRRGCEGLLLTALSSIQELPSPGRSIGEYTIKRIAQLKKKHWLLQAVDQMGDKYWLSLVPGDFEAINLSSDAFRRRRSIRHKNLMRLARWFPSEARWGCRVIIVSEYEGSSVTRRRARFHAITEKESEALFLALADATATLHKAGMSHGFISPQVVFRKPDNSWILGGQALILLAERGYTPYLYPIAVAPEVELNNFKTITPAADVYSIAATVCCLRQEQHQRNQNSLTPLDIDPLFSSDSLKTILRKALSGNPSDRYPDANALLAEITGGQPDYKEQEDSLYSVVISYSRKNEKQAQQLIADLGLKGIRAWWDKDMIPGGVQWRKAIVSAIENCRVVIFLVSSASMESAQVPRELDIATETNKAILPICLEDVEIKGELRYLLAGLHRLMFFGNTAEENMNQLIRTLGELGVTPTSPRSA